MNRFFAVTLLMAVVLLLGSCAWVKITPEGSRVNVATADAVAGCERKGRVNVSLQSRIAGVERKAAKVETELATLARNEGALLGGDTVVAESPPVDGRQKFSVYKCKR